MIYANKQYGDLLVRVEETDERNMQLTLINDWRFPGQAYSQYRAGHTWVIQKTALLENWRRKGNILNV